MCDVRTNRRTDRREGGNSGLDLGKFQKMMIGIGLKTKHSHVKKLAKSVNIPLSKLCIYCLGPRAFASIWLVDSIIWLEPDSVAAQIFL